MQKSGIKWGSKKGVCSGERGAVEKVQRMQKFTEEGRSDMKRVGREGGGNASR